MLNACPRNGACIDTVTDSLWKTFVLSSVFRHKFNTGKEYMAGPIKKSGYSRLVDKNLMPALHGWLHDCAAEKPMVSEGVFIADGGIWQLEGCELAGILQSKQTNHSHYVYKLS